MKVDVETFLKELETLVNIDSGQGNPAGITAVGDFFKARLDALGYITEQVFVGEKTGRCLVAKNREAAHYDVMLVGHIDTVFETGETQKRPFRRDDTRAYGVGVIDMKQGALQMLYNLEALPKETCDKLNIVAIFNPDEEIGSIYSRPLLEEYAKITDYAFVFEAALTDGARTFQRKGRYCAKVNFHGRAGHAGYIFDGVSVSAVNELVYWANELNGRCKKRTGTSVNVGKISGGYASNVVPEFAQLEFESRYFNLREYEKLLRLIERLKAHAQKNGVRIEVLEERKRPPLVPSKKTRLYETRLKELAEKHGVPFTSKPRGGVSDANYIAACGAVCIDGLAPTGDFDHSDQEYLEISTIEPNVRFSYLMLCDLVDYLTK